MSLTPDAVRTVLRRRQWDGINKSTVICRALAVYGAVAAAWDAGGHAVVVHKDGTRHRLMLGDAGGRAAGEHDDHDDHDEPFEQDTDRADAPLALDPDLLHPAACHCLGSSDDSACPMRWTARSAGTAPGDAGS